MPRRSRPGSNQRCGGTPTVDTAPRPALPAPALPFGVHAPLPTGAAAAAAATTDHTPPSAARHLALHASRPTSVPLLDVLSHATTPRHAHATAFATLARMLDGDFRSIAFRLLQQLDTVTVTAGNDERRSFASGQYTFSYIAWHRTGAASVSNVNGDSVVRGVGSAASTGGGVDTMTLAVLCLSDDRTRRRDAFK